MVHVCHAGSGGTFFFQKIDEQAKSINPSIQRFVGATGDIGKMLSIDNKWALNIVKQVGNYGESFDAN